MDLWWLAVIWVERAVTVLMVVGLVIVVVGQARQGVQELRDWRRW